MESYNQDIATMIARIETSSNAITCEVSEYDKIKEVVKDVLNSEPYKVYYLNTMLLLTESCLVFKLLRAEASAKIETARGYYGQQLATLNKLRKEYEQAQVLEGPETQETLNLKNKVIAFARELEQVILPNVNATIKNIDRESSMQIGEMLKKSWEKYSQANNIPFAENIEALLINEKYSRKHPSDVLLVDITKDLGAAIDKDNADIIAKLSKKDKESEKQASDKPAESKSKDVESQSKEKASDKPVESKPKDKK